MQELKGLFDSDHAALEGRQGQYPDRLRGVLAGAPVATCERPDGEGVMGLKALDWFVIPRTKRTCDEYHFDALSVGTKDRTPAELLLAFWTSIGSNPGDCIRRHE